MNMGSGSREPETRKPIAKPGSTAWLIASPSMLCLFSSRKTPGTAQAMAVNAPVRTIHVSSSVQIMAGLSQDSPARGARGPFHRGDLPIHRPSAGRGHAR